ncbi:hypothetical protein [uncultured Marinococcus sp.]|uniref:hypothetical protein n=1 Tax=uncultured Marinococcus sp. TaxID=487012 RepID=UPI002623598F|nr:hypothetical protein [uncultured Marinococcus sp.]
MERAHKRTLIINAVLSYFLAAGLTGLLTGGPFTDQESDDQLFYLGMAGYVAALAVIGFAFYKRTEFWRTFGIISCWTFPVIGLGIAFVISVAQSIM